MNTIEKIMLWFGFVSVKRVNEVLRHEAEEPKKMAMAIGIYGRRYRRFIDNGQLSNPDRNRDLH